MRSAAEGAPRRLRSLTPLSLLARFASMAALGLMILLAPAFTQRWLRVLLTAALLVNGLAALSVSVFERRQAHPHALLSGCLLYTSRCV